MSRVQRSRTPESVKRISDGHTTNYSTRGHAPSAPCQREHQTSQQSRQTHKIAKADKLKQLVPAGALS
ncbi:MAG TPA: hypothetical protein VLS45_08700, partial [Methylomicrobium sp.]|nr:hypothetical protein [Methylomicrobium sp.]